MSKFIVAALAITLLVGGYVVASDSAPAADPEGDALIACCWGGGWGNRGGGWGRGSRERGWGNGSFGGGRRGGYCYGG